MLSIDLTDIIPRTSQGIPVMLERRELGTEYNGKNGKTIFNVSKVRQKLLASGVETNGIVREDRNHSINKLNEKKKFSSSYITPSSTSASTTSLLRLILHILGRGSEEREDHITVPRPPQGPPKHNGRYRQVHSNIPSRETKNRILSKDKKYNGTRHTVQTRRGLSTTDVVRHAANEIHPYYFISSSENVEETFSPVNHVSGVSHTGLNDSLGEKVSHSRVPSDSSSLFRSAPTAAAVAASSDLKVPKEVLKESLPQGICEESLIGLLLDACTDEDGTVALGDVLSFLASNEDNTEDSVPLNNNKISMTNSEATLKAYFRVFILIGARQYPVDDKMRTTTIPPQTPLKRATTAASKKRKSMGEKTREKEENTSVNADSPWLLFAEQLFHHLSSFPRQLLYTTGPLGEERTPPVEWADRWDSWSNAPSALRELPILQVWPLIMFPRFVVLMTRWGQRPIDVLRELQKTCASSQNGSILSLGTTTSTNTGGSVLTDGSHGYSVSSQHPYYYEEDGDIVGKQTGNDSTSSDISNGSNSEGRNDLVNSDTTRVQVRVKTRDSVHRINCLLNTWENESLNDTVESHYQPSYHSSENPSLPSQRRSNTPMTKNMRFNGKTMPVQPPSKKISRYYDDDGKTDKPRRMIPRAWDEEFSPYAGSTFRASAYSLKLADATTNTAEKREKRRSRTNGKVKNHPYRKKENNCFFAARLHSAVKSGHQIGKNLVEDLPLNGKESKPSKIISSSHVRPNSRLSFFSSFQIFPSTTELSDLACDVLKRAHGERHLTKVRKLENDHQQEREQQQQQQEEQGEEQQMMMMEHKREQEEKQHYNHNQEGSSGTKVSSLLSLLPINNGVFVNHHESEGSAAIKQDIEIPSANTVVVGLPKGMMHHTIPHALVESEDKQCILNSANPIIALKKEQKDNIPCTLTAETLRSPCNVDMVNSLQKSNNKVLSEKSLSGISSALHPLISVESAVRNNDIKHQELELSAPTLPVNSNTTLLPIEIDESDPANEGLVGMKRAATEEIYCRWMGFKARRALSRQRILQKHKVLHCFTDLEPPPLPHYSGDYGNCSTPVGSANSETATFRELTVSLLGRMSSQKTRASVKQRKRVRFFNIVLLLQRVGHGYLSRKSFKVNLIKNEMKPPVMTEDSFLSDQIKETPPPLLNTNTYLKDVSAVFPTNTTPMDTSIATPSNTTISVSVSTLTTTTTNNTTNTTPNANPTARQRLSGVTFVAYGEDIHREIKSEWREGSSESCVKNRSTPPDFWYGRITRQVDRQKQRQSQQQQEEGDQEKQKEVIKEQTSKPTTEHLIIKRIKTPVGSPMNNESDFDTLESESPIPQEKVTTPETHFLLAIATEGSREAHSSDSVTPSEFLLTNTEVDGSNFTTTLSGAPNSNSFFSAAPSCCFSICSTRSVHSVSPSTQVLKELDDPFPFEQDEEEEEEENNDDDDMKNFSDSLSLSSEEFQNDRGVNATMDYIVPTGLTDQPAMGEHEAVLLIQRVGRGFTDRGQIHFSLLVNVSTFEICVIQRAAAGYYDRKQLGYRYHAVREAERELQWFHHRNRSAVQIQRMIRGFLARQRTKKIQRKLWVRIELHIAREQHEIYEEF